MPEPVAIRRLSMTTNRRPESPSQSRTPELQSVPDSSLEPTTLVQLTVGQVPSRQ